ncbi:hypothetical protein Fmac_010892 [Flemingia macrophylla]|uniref:Uncharacterized protein n=1 Tax=Flemingia macrophylla TaxID=520843 RepID=A0ABD1MKW1_9FABA
MREDDHNRISHNGEAPLEQHERRSNNGGATWKDHQRMSTGGGERSAAGLRMGDLAGSLPESVQVKITHDKKPCVGLWGQSVLLQVIEHLRKGYLWRVVTNKEVDYGTNDVICHQKARVVNAKDKINDMVRDVFMGKRQKRASPISKSSSLIKVGPSQEVSSSNKGIRQLLWSPNQVNKIQRHPFFICKTLTYVDVNLATDLHSLSIRQGDIVMLFLRNCPQFTLTLLGVSYRGTVFTITNPLYTPRSSPSKLPSPKLGSS